MLGDQWPHPRHVPGPQTARGTQKPHPLPTTEEPGLCFWLPALRPGQWPGGPAPRSGHSPQNGSTHLDATANCSSPEGKAQKGDPVG